jgi:hypothetical protein
MPRPHAARVLVLAALGLALSAAPSHAWSIGANSGLTVYSPGGGGGSLTSFTFPAGGGSFIGFMPGMRAAFPLAKEQQEIFTEFSLSNASTAGFSENQLELTANFQENFTGDNATPFVNAGVGLFHVGDSSESSTSVLFGAGFGVRKRIADDHGLVRGELHIGYVTEGDSGGSPFIDGGTLIEIKLGFDLVMK